MPGTVLLCRRYQQKGRTTVVPVIKPVKIAELAVKTHIALIPLGALLVEGEIVLVDENGYQLDGVLQANLHAVGVHRVGQPLVVVDLLDLGNRYAAGVFCVRLVWRWTSRPRGRALF